MRLPLASLLLLVCPVPACAASKPREVSTGAVRTVRLADGGDPVRVRPLVVNGRRTEWLGADTHVVTEGTYVAQRMVRVNDLLPGERGSRWTWQRGPWLQVDRTTGHTTVLHLPDFDPQTSGATWFRDYAAYCGVRDGKSAQAVAVVWEMGARRPALERPISASHMGAGCAPAEWQRGPVRVTLTPAGQASITFQLPANGAPREENADDN